MNKIEELLLIETQKILNQNKISTNKLVDFLNYLKKIEKNNLFLFAYIRDNSSEITKILVSLFSEKEINIDNHTRLVTLLEVLVERLKFFPNWDITKNHTAKMITEGKIRPEELKPFIRYPDEDYVAFYNQQNINIEKKVHSLVGQPNKHRTHVNIALEKNINHSFRKANASHYIELLMGILDTSVNNKELNFSWLDIGCSVGYISNSVESNKYSKSPWEIVGCDLQTNRIKLANHLAAENRRYFAKNAFDLIEQSESETLEFDIISMFEFCEHFTDPAQLIKRVAKFNPKALVIATPLEQKLNAPYDSSPDKAHLWGLSRISLEKMLATTELEILCTFENRVGKYQKGLDWLTIIAVSKEVKNSIGSTFINKNR